MLLKGKTAIVHGGAGAIGSAVARPDGGLLHRRPSFDDVANIAVFAASDWARTMTATEINFTAGAVVD
jgi:3-oxoacyl-[acyl-carrier protein] reductase